MIYFTIPLLIIFFLLTFAFDCPLLLNATITNPCLNATRGLHEATEARGVAPEKKIKGNRRD